MSSIHGMRKASVLPLPVLAAARTSLQRSRSVNIHTVTMFPGSSSDYCDRLKMLVHLRGAILQKSSVTEPRLTSPPAGGGYFCAGSQSCVQSPSPSLRSTCSHSPSRRERRKTCPQMPLKCQTTVNESCDAFPKAHSGQVDVKHEIRVCKDKEIVFLKGEIISQHPTCPCS